MCVVDVVRSRDDGNGLESGRPTMCRGQWRIEKLSEGMMEIHLIQNIVVSYRPVHNYLYKCTAQREVFTPITSPLDPPLVYVREYKNFYVRRVLGLKNEG